MGGRCLSLNETIMPLFHHYVPIFQKNNTATKQTTRRLSVQYYIFKLIYFFTWSVSVGVVSGESKTGVKELFLLKKRFLVFKLHNIEQDIHERKKLSDIVN